MSATLPTRSLQDAPFDSISDGSRPTRGRLQRFWRGAEADPRWAKPALFALLSATTALY
jgi:hypothetical protein